MKPVILSLLGALLLTSACSDGDTKAPAAQTPTPAPTAAGCPAGAATELTWPSEVPEDLPKPPGAALKKVQRQNGVTSVFYSTPTSLRESLIFVLREVPKAGFTTGRGDAEPAEADVPFGRNGLVGIYKMIIAGRCSTEWLVAVTRTAGGSPILRPHPRVSSSPLPFG
jgi:hypothetical protein